MISRGDRPSRENDMNHLLQNSRGVGRGPMVPALKVEMARLWSAHRCISAARVEYGLGSGAISTLRALISFLQDGGEPIVFASNATICKRAENQSERNLRRHILTLVKIGLIERRDSPNRKRYVIKHPDGPSYAFGLDLSPLLLRADEIEAMAAEVAAETGRIRFYRKQLSSLLYAAEQDGHGELVEELRPLRRRKVSSDDLHSACECLIKLLTSNCAEDQHQTALNGETKMTDNDGQIVRHKDNTESIRKDSDSEGVCNTEVVTESLLVKIKRACPEALSYADRDPTSLWEVEELAIRLALWTGIGRDLLTRAISSVGRTQAAITVLGIFERQERIRNLPAYFNALMFGRRSASYDPWRMLG